MRQKSETRAPSEQIAKNIRRAIRKHHSPKSHTWPKPGNAGTGGDVVLRC